MSSLIYDLIDRTTLLGPARVDRRPPRDMQRNLDAASWNNLIELVWQMRDVLRGIWTSEPEAELKTLDDVPVAGASYTPDNGSVTVMRATVVAGDHDGHAAYWELLALFSCVGGALRQVGSTRVVAADADPELAGTAADLVADAGEIVVRLTGLAAATLSWLVSLRAGERALP